MFGLGGGELVIAAIVLVLFVGSKQVPELARGIAEFIRLIRSGFSDTNNKTDDQGK